jgi:hypothetical protein
MDQVSALPSKAIPAILIPTFHIFTPLLQARRASIAAIPRQTPSYGAPPPQKVDIHSPTSAAPRAPLLIFFYGGGLSGGDKILPAVAIPDSLVYANLGAFFASRDFVTLIPDYRRVNDPQTGAGEGAVCPSGAEDLAAVLGWLESGGLKGEGEGERRDVFIMGNSAGGVHLASWLLAPQFEAERRRYLSESRVMRLSGAVLFAVPFHFKNAGPERREVLKVYYGDAWEGKCPFGLLEAVKATGSRGKGLKPVELGIPPVLNLEGELDPEDEILAPGRDFVQLWMETLVRRGWRSGF